MRVFVVVCAGFRIALRNSVLVIVPFSSSRIGSLITDTVMSHLLCCNLMKDDKVHQGLYESYSQAQRGSNSVK